MGRHALPALALLGVATASVLPAQSAWSQNGKIPCRCRTPQGTVPLGSSICLRYNGSMVMARCEMVLNNTSWTFTTTPCPTARLGPADRRG